MMNEKILVTGVGGPAGRGTVEHLAGLGHILIGTDMQEVESPVDSFYTVPPALDPSYGEILVEMIEKERVALFIPTVTEELPIVARLKETIEGYGCKLFISPPDGTEIADDKLKTVRFLEEHKIPVPLSFDGGHSREEMSRKLAFPILAKPRVSRGGRGVLLHRTRETLEGERREDILFQEFIPGKEFDLNLFIEEDGEISASVVLEKTALKEGITGNALAVERVDMDDVAQLGIRVARLLKLEGPLDIDFRLRRDGTPVLLEINARLGGNILSAREVLDQLITTWKRSKENAYH
ncbi:MAG: ATP-grasp domain-containing protein [Deltaproteobacteria bacterium]|nr:ATP-grasp domain-containing protein [Deltaproteobacteria bacterium]